MFFIFNGRDDEMEIKKNNWKKIVKNLIFILFFAILGAIGGYLVAPYLNNISLFDIIYTIFIFGFSFPIHIVLHEVGHILGGLISGYDFIMFRLFDTVWIKTASELSKRKEYVPGMMGQALMVPPKNEENPPFFLYHASGILMNLLTALLFIGFGRVFTIDWLAHFFTISAFVALFLGITNAIPFKGSDGYNLLKQFKDKAATAQLTDLLYMYQEMVQGASLERLQSYVDLEAYSSFEDPNTATIYSLHAQYLFEMKDFKGARKVCEVLYENIEDLFEGHRPLVTLDYLFSLLLTDPNHPEIPRIIESKIYKQFKDVKQSDYIRFRAAVALYYEKDLEKAEKLLAEGEKLLHLSPTLTDEHFERTMYQYLREDLEKYKAPHLLQNETIN